MTRIAKKSAASSGAGKRTRRSSVSTRERAYLYIQAQIHQGVLTPGKPISELLLAKELGSSRTPIREAIGQLTSEGLLEATHNRGATVRKLTRSDIIDLCEVREALELFTAEKASRQGITPLELQNMRATVEGVRRLRNDLAASGGAVLNQEQMREFIQLDRTFHELIVRLTLNRAMQDIIRKGGVLVQIFAMPRRGHDVALLDRIVDEHSRITEGLAEGETAKVHALLSAHIQNSMKQRLEEFDLWERNHLLSGGLPRNEVRSGEATILSF